MVFDLVHLQGYCYDHKDPSFQRDLLVCSTNNLES
ncbi:MAG: hypothetical protein ACI89U_002080, partial [Gammaproteobacteria bacterium]